MINNVPLMTGRITDYPAEVKAGDVFHIKGYSKDRDTFLQDVPAMNVELPSYTHFLHPHITSGSQQGQAPWCSGQDDQGGKFWDFPVTATTDLGSYAYILKTDSFDLTDVGWGPDGALADPPQPTDGNGNHIFWTITIKITAPPQQ